MCHSCAVVSSHMCQSKIKEEYPADIEGIATPDRPRTEWIALDEVARFDVSPEDPNHPIEGAICQGEDRGWRAADSGSQSIRICFECPRNIHCIRLCFVERERPNARIHAPLVR